MRRRLIVGNWKMNGSLATNIDFISKLHIGVHGIQDIDIVLCVPTPYLAQIQAAAYQYRVVLLGAQDVSVHISGAYTGEVSASMLKEFDCRYVIVGHSERRIFHHEVDRVIAYKALMAIKSGLIPIICIGETLDERQTGQTKSIISHQLNAVLNVLDGISIKEIVIAYEPKWAIGTNNVATPIMVKEVYAILRQALLIKYPMAIECVRIIYGGSIKPNNARDLLTVSCIDGLLVGSAALDVANFLQIIYSAINN